MSPLRSGARGIRLGLAGTLALAGALVWTPVTPAAAAPGHIAIVIAGQGASCVPWHSGITGDEVLNDVASVRYRNDGLIVQIGGVPSSAKADDTHFWSYWHYTGGGWRYSSSGASGYQPAAGTVEGWSFDNGGSSAPQPPSVSYAAVCSDAPAHTSHPRPSHAPVSRHRSRSAGRVAAPHRSGTTSAPAPATHSATSGAARSSAARSAARAASSAAAASGSSGAAASAAPGTPGSSSVPLRPLTKLAADHSTGSPLPLILTGVLVLLLGGGAGVVALRRRTGRA